MGKFAADTSVSSMQSRNEIERTLTRYGAGQFMYGTNGRSAVIAFEFSGKRVKFMLPLPDKSSREFTHTPARGTERSPAAVDEAYEQAVRQRWRALALVIKAKLEAVDAGISIFESEFLSNIMLADGQTVGEYMIPQVEQHYKTGIMPAMLPMLTDGRG